jgi:hypothetical protein
MYGSEVAEPRFAIRSVQSQESVRYVDVAAASGVVCLIRRKAIE